MGVIRAHITSTRLHLTQNVSVSISIDVYSLYPTPKNASDDISLYPFVYTYLWLRACIGVYVYVLFLMSFKACLVDITSVLNQNLKSDLINFFQNVPCAVNIYSYAYIIRVLECMQYAFPYTSKSTNICIHPCTYRCRISVISNPFLICFWICVHPRVCVRACIYHVYLNGYQYACMHFCIHRKTDISKQNWDIVFECMRTCMYIYSMYPHANIDAPLCMCRYRFFLYNQLFASGLNLTLDTISFEFCFNPKIFIRYEYFVCGNFLFSYVTYKEDRLI